MSCLLGNAAGTVEQRLIIDLGKGSGGGGDGGESSSENTGSPVRSKAPRRFRAEGSPDSLDEIRALIKEMDKVLTSRIDSLAKRVDRLEANQNSLRHTQMAEWTALSDEKRIRMFTSKNTWLEAERVCKINSGSLLLVDSEEENRRALEMLQSMSSDAGDAALYWIEAPQREYICLHGHCSARTAWMCCYFCTE